MRPRLLSKSFWKFKHLLAITVVAALLGAVFEGLSVGLLIPFLQNLSGEAAEPFRTGWSWVDQHILVVDGTKIERLYRICGLILVATWLRAGFNYISRAVGMESRASVIADLRTRVVDQLQSVSLSYFKKLRAGNLINTLTHEMKRVSASFGVVIALVTLGSLMIVYVTAMLLISWQLSLLILGAFGLLSIGLTRLIRRIRRDGEQVTATGERFVSRVSEFINGIRTVTAFNAQPFERRRLKHSIDKFARAVIKTSRGGLLVRPLSQAIVGTVLIVVIVVATQYFVLRGRLEMAYLLTFLFALFRLVPVVHQLNNQRGEWAKNREAVDTVERVLRREGKPYLDDGERTDVDLKDAITFDNVSFAYDDEMVLRNVSTQIEAGKKTALVGASGAGKSTLVDLLPRFHDPTEGRVLLDGVDLREYKASALRDKIGVVSQDTFIFHDTVRANIAYGLDDVSDEDIVEASQRANALDFILDMEDDFDTVLGDRGVRLSGGQRQRIAIARAILRDPEILVLDEATSALDSVSENMVQESLERLMRGRTVISIAHRLSTVEDADWVIVLEDGEIVEQGPYDELLEERGQLWEYHSLQYQTA